MAGYGSFVRLARYTDKWFGSRRCNDQRSSMSELPCWQQLTFRAVEGCRTAADFSFATGESARQDIAGPLVDLYGCTSLSGNMKTSSTIPTIVKSRKAVSSPFHSRDCHMRNHSPPTEMN